MMASLFVVNATHVTYLIANHTTGTVCAPFMEPAPTSYMPANGPVQPVRVSGATAEWITGRPMNGTTRELDELPAFKPVRFTDCHVVSGPGPRVDEREELPAGVQLINASKLEDDPYRSVTLAVARRLARNSFSTDYLGMPM
jgi:hypothetical protein